MNKKFTKEQILKSVMFENRRDLLTALLVDDKTYTLDAVNKILDKYMKGKVK